MIKHKKGASIIHEYRFMDPLAHSPIQVFIWDFETPEAFKEFFECFWLDEVQKEWYTKSKWLTIKPDDNAVTIIWLKDYLLDVLIHEFSHAVRANLKHLWIKNFNDDELTAYFLGSFTCQFFNQVNPRKFKVSKGADFYNTNKYYDD